MYHPVFVFGVPLLVAAFGAPAVFILGHAAERDPAHLYLVFGTKPTLIDLLEHPDVREIGPYSPPFSRLVTTPAELHTSLVDQDYWFLPATVLAELCGIDL